MLIDGIALYIAGGDSQYGILCKGGKEHPGNLICVIRKLGSACWLQAAIERIANLSSVCSGWAICIARYRKAKQLTLLGVHKTTAPGTQFAQECLYGVSFLSFVGTALHLTVQWSAEEGTVGALPPTSTATAWQLDWTRRASSPNQVPCRAVSVSVWLCS